MMLDLETLAALVAIVGTEHVVTQAGELEKYERDWRGRYCGSTLCVVRPKNSGEVAASVRCCSDARLAIVPQGGNTGMSAGALPPPALANVVVCLDRMNRVREVDQAGNTMTVEAGCTLAAIQNRADRAGRSGVRTLSRSEGSPCVFPCRMACLCRRANTGLTARRQASRPVLRCHDAKMGHTTAGVGKAEL